MGANINLVRDSNMGANISLVRYSNMSANRSLVRYSNIGANICLIRCSKSPHIATTIFSLYAQISAFQGNCSLNFQKDLPDEI